MTAKECIKGRRSIRKFTDQPIDHSLLEEIIETASYSPSWKNTQIARYIAVEGELKDKIADECTSAFPNNGSIIKGAPMLIVIAAIKTDAAMKGMVLLLQEEEIPGRCSTPASHPSLFASLLTSMASEA